VHRWAWWVVACGCGRIHFDPLSGPSDGSVGSDVAAAACDPTKPFGSPQPIASLVSGALDGTLRLTPDELHGVFWSTRSTADADIYNADRLQIGGAFAVTSQPALNSTGNDYEGTLTEDGLGLVFRSDRAGGAGGSDLYTATRGTLGSPWGNITLVASLDTASEEIQPYLPPGRSELYYVSDASGRHVIYRAARTGYLSFSAGAPVLELDDGVSNTRDPVSSADGVTIYVGSDRPGSAGGYDVWVATRPNDTVAFGMLQVVNELSTFGDDGPNYISVDGCRMYMSGTFTGLMPYLAVKPL
jgi:hypothetical protein